MVRAMLFPTETETNESFTPLLRLIERVMSGSCLFTCIVNWKPADSLAADVMGIGGAATQIGDRILSLSPEYHIDRVCLSDLSFQRFPPWSQTILVREASPGTTKHLRHMYIKFIGDYGMCKEPLTLPSCYKLKQSGMPPVYELVGGCYLSTTRWVSPSRGLQRRRWGLSAYDPYDAKTDNIYNAKYDDLDDRNSDSAQFDVILL